MAEFQTSIEIEAPPERVFDHLVTEAGLTAWMGQSAHLDARVEGVFAVDIAGHPVRGRFLEITRPHRVIVSWGFAGSDDLPPGASTVSFELSATPLGTRVDLVHSGLPETEVPGHRDGWDHFVPRLELAATGRDPGIDTWSPRP